MVNEDFSAFCLVALFCISLEALFVSVKAWRDRNRRSVAYISIDFLIVTLFPVILRTWTWIPPATIQRLFLSGLLFFLAVDVIYLLFASNATRLLIPLASLYLPFIVSLSSLEFLLDPLGVNLALFTYNLLDEITLAALAVTFFAVVLPPLRQIRYKLMMQLDSRTPENTLATEVMHCHTRQLAGAKQNESYIHQSRNSLLPKAVKLFRAKEYRHCIEFCGAELERIILLKLKLEGLSAAKIDQPINLQDHVSKLSSTMTPIPQEDILQLRKLRNDLRIPSQEATAQQAELAIALVRRTSRMLFSNTLPSHPRES